MGAGDADDFQWQMDAFAFAFELARQTGIDLITDLDFELTGRAMTEDDFEVILRQLAGPGK